MIIQSLCQYYDILANEKKGVVPKPGYSQGRVSFALVISRGGDLENIIDLRNGDKKIQPQLMDVPYQDPRSVDIYPYFVCDKANYLFGIEKGKKEEFAKKGSKKKKGDYPNASVILEDTGKEIILVSERSQKCFEAFKVLHHKLLDTNDDVIAKSFLKFLDAWNPTQSLEHPKIRENKDEILKGGFFVVKCEDTYLHQNEVIRRSWDDHFSISDDNQKTVAVQCLVSGQNLPIAGLHQKIMGVYNAQSAGAYLISFNDPAFESYGKKDSSNAPVSELSMFKYTTALNHLLERGSKNKLRIGDTTTVFWADTENKTCENLANFFFDPREIAEENQEKTEAHSRVIDKKTLQLVGDILEKVRTGQPLKESDIGTDPEKTNFFILGLSPNNARLAVRYWYKDNFGNFVTHIVQHFLDMEIIKSEYEPHYISMYRLLKETVPLSSKDNASSPLLGGLVMRSIIGNTQYPVQMYSAILTRVKVERSINYVRAGFIKAYLSRLARFGVTKLKEDLITVSLNEENSNVPYRLGRLFAVLERAQSDTNKEMKSTINSKYFSSASTTPAVVFPVLLKLAQHHIAKSDWGFKSNQSIEEIVSSIDEFPAYLNLEEQGMFMLGYYHQRKDFFKKKETASPAKEEVKHE
jgi:CRISPR-associated protein Csd1